MNQSPSAPSLLSHMMYTGFQAEDSIYICAYGLYPRRAPDFAGIIIYVLSHAILTELVTTQSAQTVKTKANLQFTLALFNHLLHI